jgi:hypothetical protein
VSDGTSLLFDLPGFRVVSCEEDDSGVRRAVIMQVADEHACPRCGVLVDGKPVRPTRVADQGPAVRGPAAGGGLAQAPVSVRRAAVFAAGVHRAVGAGAAAASPHRSTASSARAGGVSVGAGAVGRSRRVRGVLVERAPRVGRRRDRPGRHAGCAGADARLGRDPSPLAALELGRGGWLAVIEPVDDLVRRPGPRPAGMAARPGAGAVRRRRGDLARRSARGLADGDRGGRVGPVGAVRRGDPPAAARRR